jgi:hypothetical protein
MTQTWKHADRPRPLPAGPWDDEPDKMQWVDEATNLDCLIVRNHSGALCGYVGVPNGHPHYGKDYDTPDVEVHGGLTYADRCQEDAPEGHGICHIPDPGRPGDVWWFGFDCAHYQDLIPAYSQDHIGLGGVYRNIAYVEAECARLAAQLVNA